MITTQVYVETNHDDKTLFIDKVLNKSKTILTDIGFSCEGGVFSLDRLLTCQSNETSLLSSANSVISILPAGNKVQIRESVTELSFTGLKSNSSKQSKAIKYLYNGLKAESQWYINML
ncbi:hypothetical protein KCM76_23670 [Zooshikella marina]|uniref:hypothetical protein n=1 Tax=Zooshikella ganghwensis TaxID=202772 RepID=UPI001BAF2A2A|nr:hypothetical protein [Zooshikella ganghwensis]MBU2709015.1 hypothetical protein [Zooshikella ganghwensis]